MAQHFTLARFSRLLSARGLAVVGVAAGLASIAGCKVDDALGPTNDQAIVQFINADPGYATADLYVDSVDALAGLPYGQGSSIYVPAPTTPHLFEVRGNTDTATLASNQLVVQNQGTYTFILTQHPTGGGLVVLSDTVTGTPANAFGLRFVNAAPSVGAVDVYITGADSALADADPVARSLPFEGVSSYQYFPPGPAARLRITKAGTTQDVLVNSDGSNGIDASGIVAGQVYTIVVVEADGGGLPLTGLAVEDF